MVMNRRFPKMAGVSWLAKEVLASQEGPRIQLHDSNQTTNIQFDQGTTKQ